MKQFIFLKQLFLIVLILSSCIIYQACNKDKNFSSKDDKLSTETKSMQVVQSKSIYGQASTQTQRQAVLNSLNQFLEYQIYPAKLEQAIKLDQQKFVVWLSQAALHSDTKKDIQLRLQPILSQPTIVALLLKGVKLKNTNATADIALIATPPSSLTSVDGTNLFNILAATVAPPGTSPTSNEPIKQCKFNSCYYSNPATSGTCTSTTSWDKICPPPGIRRCTGNGSCQPLTTSSPQNSVPSTIYTALSSF